MEFQPYEPFASNMWIISLLPDRLPGRVYEKWAKGQLIIHPLVTGLPLTDGTLAQRFFASIGDAYINDYVTFSWKRPGERGFDPVKQEYGDPRAIDVEVVEKDEAMRLSDAAKAR